ncbi:hypothetical protein SAMN04488029_2706 [Reichenbachiella faecimaris]|uniref:Uncharacterized protein n=1 Tax=Reichenbachiella faecimaris TaxID=692418 RepID=A0A1W2GHR0_REIFA|nr:hypothetical protein [Reichenbachiella faecimaris]SMD36084.1 hypothetical protein SAMN04488029_2706 [Reichenbachiella faecimaris]
MKFNEHLEFKYKFKGGINRAKKIREEKEAQIAELELQKEFFEYYKKQKPSDTSHIRHCENKLEELNKSLEDIDAIEESIIDKSNESFSIYLYYKKDKAKSTISWIKDGKLNALENPRDLEESPEGIEEIEAIADMVKIETDEFTLPLLENQNFADILRFYRYTPSQAIAYNAMLFIRMYWSPSFSSLSKSDSTYRPMKILDDFFEFKNLFPTSEILLKSSSPKNELNPSQYEGIFHSVMEEKEQFATLVKRISNAGVRKFRETQLFEKRRNFIEDPYPYFQTALLLFTTMDISNDGSDMIYVMEMLELFKSYDSVVKKFASKNNLTRYQNTLWAIFADPNIKLKFDSYIELLKKERKFKYDDEYDLYSFLRPPGDVNHSKFLQFIDNS